MEAKYYPKDDTPVESEEEPADETPQEEERVAVVESGEGFWQVAKRALGDPYRYDELAEYNGMSIDTPLYAGMELKLPD